ncbi:Pentatricopeptide repeat-containing protein [Dendrobium catenatum]|uniref:Pentatricopeptide repeat-containing protein n=1 Tax=Dendrobium catenatum TaxID=906689 RepID=A0A2I0VN37_9ASPA|nr:Pentatricopeptide repeat-containing protein [Dendrobium catenatum]
MNCGRRSAVDDDRSCKIRLAVDDDRRQGRWVVDDARSRIAFYQAQANDSLDQIDRNLRAIRKMPMSSATIPRYSSSSSISSSASRRRHQSRQTPAVVDDYAPLELPLRWRDPSPEYPPLELPLRWRDPPPFQCHSASRTQHPPLELATIPSLQLDFALVPTTRVDPQLDADSDSVADVNIVEGEQLARHPPTLQHHSGPNTTPLPLPLPLSSCEPKSSQASSCIDADVHLVEGEGFKGPPQLPAHKIQLESQIRVPTDSIKLTLPLSVASAPSLIQDRFPRSLDFSAAKTQTFDHAGRNHSDSAVYPAPPPAHAKSGPCCSRETDDDRDQVTIPHLTLTQPARLLTPVAGPTRIKLLNLLLSKIYGSITDFIVDLPKLEVFQLWEKEIIGSILQRQSMDGLLQLLDCSSNKLNGNLLPGGLPDTSKFRISSKITLSGNYLFGHIPSSIDYALGPDIIIFHLFIFTFNTLINGLCKAGRIGKMDQAYGMMQKIVEWFEKMPELGYSPYDVPHSVNAYGRLGNVDMARALYDQELKGKWNFDLATFVTMFGVYGASGHFNGALNVFEEMKERDVKPKSFTHNKMLEVIGRCGRPWQLKNIYKEMVGKRIVPNMITYYLLLKAYSQAWYVMDPWHLNGGSSLEAFTINCAASLSLIKQRTPVSASNSFRFLYDIRTYNELSGINGPNAFGPMTGMNGEAQSNILLFRNDSLLQVAAINDENKIFDPGGLLSPSRQRASTESRPF